jgi:ABC-type amino acid transport substrate-binding protein
MVLHLLRLVVSRSSWRLGGSILVPGLAGLASAQEPQDEMALKDGSALLWRATAQRVDDAMLLKKVRALRVLVTYDRTNFHVVDGQPRGYEYELTQQFEKYLNHRLGKRTLHTRLIYVPMALEDLIPALLDGRGDIVAANLTVTSERARQVAFSHPYLEDVKEVVVTHRTAPPLSQLEDLAGRTVMVLAGSSYAAHLRALSAELQAKGLAPIAMGVKDVTKASANILAVFATWTTCAAPISTTVDSRWARASISPSPPTMLVPHACGRCVSGPSTWA